MRKIVWMAAAGMMAASAAFARQAGVEIENPVWAREPSAQEASGFYPERAMADEKTGVGIVRCSAKADGGLTNCRVLCEAPAKYDFGKAAQRMALRFKLSKTQVDGFPSKAAPSRSRRTSIHPGSRPIRAAINLDSL